MVKPGEKWVRMWDKKPKPVLYTVVYVDEHTVAYKTDKYTSHRTETVGIKTWLNNLVLYKYRKNIISKRSHIA